jgi:hypothetical protein
MLNTQCRHSRCPARVRDIGAGRRLLHALAIPVALAAAMGIPAASAAAQGQVGAIVGATYSTLRGIDGLDGRTGLVGGLSIVLPSSGIFALQPEVLFTNKGGSSASPNAPSGLQLSFLDVPLLLRLKLGGIGSLHPHAYAGPYFGIRVDCSVKGTSADCDRIAGVSTKSVDVGGVVGGGLDFDFGPLVLTGGARYSFGVSKIAEFERGSVRESAKNGAFTIYTGAAIRLGSR